MSLLPDLLVLLSNWAAIFFITVTLLRKSGRTSRWSAGLLAASIMLAGLAGASWLLSFRHFAAMVPTLLATWVGAAGPLQAAILIGLSIFFLFDRPAMTEDPQRRRFLQAAGVTLAVLPPAVTTFGIISRDRFGLQHVKVGIPNLHKDLQGLRLVQITDIHLSPFLSEAEFARAIDMANETKAHLALVTGDLITRPGDPLDACLRQLSRLRSDAGALGCLGNHEIYCQNEKYVEEEGRRIGIEFLRTEARSLRFGDAYINFAGVDYQQFHAPYLTHTQSLVTPGRPNILLSHNPDVFPVAAHQGFDLTIAGHTHGGQVNVEILHQNLNVARTLTHFVRGLYRQGNSSIYVSSGIGTIGVPVRVGAPPEVSLIELCAS